MPNIPTYEPKARPTVRDPFQRDVSAAGQEWRAAQNLGSVLSERAREFQHERDVIEATEAFVAFSDEERKFLHSEYQQNGSKAFGAQKRGNDWYADAENRYSEGLTRGAQEVLREKVMSSRLRGLDRLTSHEAKQQQLSKQATLDADLALRIRNIRDGSTKNELEDMIQDTADELNELFPGVNHAKTIEGIRSRMTEEFLLEQASRNPEGIGELIEEFGDRLPQDKLDKIKKAAEDRDIEQAVDDEMRALRQMYGTDYESMLEDVKNSDLRPKVKKQVKAMVKSDYASWKEFDRVKKEEANDIATDELSDKWARGDFSGVREQAMRDPRIKGGEQTMWVDKVDAKIKYLETKDRQDDPFLRSDSETQSRVMQAIVKYPHGISKEDIMSLVGKDEGGISSAHGAAAAVKLLEQMRKKIDDRLKLCFEAINEMREHDWEQEEGGEGKRRTQSNKIAEELLEFTMQYPDKDPWVDFMEPKMELFKEEKIDEALNTLPMVDRDAADIGGLPFMPFVGKKIQQGERIRGKIVPPKKKFDQAEAEFLESWLGRDPREKYVRY